MGTFVKKTVRLEADELFERSDKAFKEHQNYEAQLVEAFKAGKLKSPRLIAKAKRICAKS